MHFIASLAAGLSVVSTALALGQAKVVNNCPYNVYLTISRPGANGTPGVLKSKATYVEKYRGTGNSLGISRGADFYSPNTPKLIFGYSDQSPTVYYSVNAQDGTLSFGSPAPDFILKASGGCKGSVGYNNGMTLTCSDANSISVYLCQTS